jgi:peptide chain release factor 2
VECQQERSQIQNREKALQMLKSKLYELEVRKRNEAKAKVEGGKLKIEWGSQIRNYVLHPYKLVKDVRTDYESTNPYAVLDGELDGFIKAFLIHREEPV